MGYLVERPHPAEELLCSAAEGVQYWIDIISKLDLDECTVLWYLHSTDGDGIPHNTKHPLNTALNIIYSTAQLFPRVVPLEGGWSEFIQQLEGHPSKY